MIKISITLVNRTITHARKEAPKVACGLLAGQRGEITAVYPCENVAQDSSAVYQFKQMDELMALREMRSKGLIPAGVYYSQHMAAAALPSAYVAQRWRNPDDLCLVVSLPTNEEPVVKAFYIRDEGICEEPLEILLTGVTADQGEAIRRVRRGFADNFFLGWYEWLRVFQQSFNDMDYSCCLALIRELELEGYDISEEEEARLIELGDLARYHYGGSRSLKLSVGDRERLAEVRQSEQYQNDGLSELLLHYEHSWRDCQGKVEATKEARIRFRLGLIMQKLGRHDAARSHYKGSLSLFEAAGASRASQEVRDMLFALDHQQKENEPHLIFQARWKPILDEAPDTSQEIRRMMKIALQGDRWRLGRQAVQALERLNDVRTLAFGLRSPLRPVRVATSAALRRLCERNRKPETIKALVQALQNESSIVRWQAAIALGRADSSVIRPLAQTLHRDQDVNVRMAAAEALGHIGDLSVIPVLQKAPNTSDSMGFSLRVVADNAIQTIEDRVSGGRSAKSSVASPSSPSLGRVRSYLRREFLADSMIIGVGGIVHIVIFVSFFWFNILLGLLGYLGRSESLVRESMPRAPESRRRRTVPDIRLTNTADEEVIVITLDDLR